jgi:hypothetical protein
MMLQVMAEECGQSPQRDDLFSDAFFRIDAYYAMWAPNPTLDGRQTAAAVEKIIERTHDYWLLKRAVEVGVQSLALRDELQSLAQDSNEAKPPATIRDAVICLVVLGEHWNTPRGRQAVEYLETQLKSAPETAADVDDARLALSALVALDDLEEYKKGAVETILQSWSESARERLAQTLAPKRYTDEQLSQTIRNLNADRKP